MNKLSALKKHIYTFKKRNYYVALVLLAAAVAVCAAPALGARALAEAGPYLCGAGGAQPGGGADAGGPAAMLDGPMSRADFCALAVAVYDAANSAGGPPAVGNPPGSAALAVPAVDIMKRAAEIGIVSDAGTGGALTREQAACMLARLADAAGAPLPEKIAAYRDNIDISSWAFVSAGRAQAAGLIPNARAATGAAAGAAAGARSAAYSGAPTGAFMPQSPLTGRHGVIAAMRAFEYISAGKARAAAMKRAAEATAAFSPDPGKPVGDYSAASPRDNSITSPAVKGKKIPILMYHAVGDVPSTSIAELFVRPSELEAQFKYLVENGYQTVTFEDLDSAGDFKKPVMLTFDDGYADNYAELFPLLKKYGLKATIFMISDAVYGGEFMTVDELAEMAGTGLVSVQSHTRTHAKLTLLGGGALAEELESSKARIEEITGKPVIALAYPFGATNKSVKEAAAKVYKYAVIAGGGKYVCGGDIMGMSRSYVDRGMSIKSYAALLG